MCSQTYEDLGTVCVSPVKVTSLSFSGTAAQITQVPAYYHLNNQDNNVRLLSKNWSFALPL